MNKKTYLSRIISFLAIICCLAGGMTPIFAADSDSDETPKIVFKNEPKRSTNLTIRKDFEGEVPESEKDTPFLFEVIIDNKPASDKPWKYTLIRSDNKKEEKTVTGQYITLKAGERAIFEYLGDGTSYLVKEKLEEDSKFECDSPKSAFVSGNMSPYGGSAEFKNKIKEDPGEDSQPELKIKKEVYYGEGFEIPEVDHEFTFRVKLDGNNYYRGSFKVTQTDDRTVFRETVDAVEEIDGESVSIPQIKLKAGETATISALKNTHYEVEELLDESWYLVNGYKQVHRGELSSSVEKTFLNTNASFMVKKHLENFAKPANPEQEFTFVLSQRDETDSNKKTAWKDAEYYLYDADKKLVPKSEGEMSEGEDLYLRHTDGYGKFSMKANQTAIFINIPDKAKYNVSEEGTEGYQQVNSDLNGYDGEVTGGITEEKVFVNKPLEPGKGTLTVSKNVRNTEAELSDEDLVFSFILYRDGAVLDGADYSVIGGKNGGTGKTKDGGIFTLTKDQTATFERLDPGKYKVEEVLLPSGYTLAETSKKVEPEETGTETDTPASVQSFLEGDLTLTGSLMFTFTNEYTPGKLDLTIHKVNNTGESSLPEAAFKLWMVNKGEETTEEDENGEQVEKTWTEVGKTEVALENCTTGTDGKFVIPDLIPGTYYLEETQAPAGYQISEAPLKLVVEEKVTTNSQDPPQQVKKINVTVSGGTQNQGSLTQGELEQQVTDGKVAITVKVANDMLYALPSSGGSGIFLYIIAGVVLMMAAGYLYWKKIRMEVI